MLMWRAVCLVIIKQVVTVPISPTDSSATFIAKGRYEPGVHTINNANPYQGVVVTEGHGKYPVIFEHSRTCKPVAQLTKSLLLLISPLT